MLPIIGFVIVSVVTVGGAQVWRLAQSPPRPLITQIAPTQRQAVQPKVWVKSPTAEHALAEQATPASAIDEPTDHLLDRHLALSGVALGTTCAGHFLYPPLGILTTPLIVYLEWPIFQAAWRDLAQKRSLKIDGLMSLFIISAWVTRAYVSSAFSIFTYFLAQKVTSQTRDRSRQKLVEMFDQQPRTVWCLVDEQEVELPFAQVQAGDTVVVYAGQTIPVDGRVSAGMATVDQHRLTGEARPVEKGIGDPVFAATLLVRGRLAVQVEKAGQATLAVQIAEILNQTTAHHLQVEERGLALAEKSVLPAVLLSVAALPLRGFRSAVAVLSAMPGVDMYFAGPLAMLNALHLAAEHGILIKDGRSLELLHTIDTVVFDKTGTLTLEQPEVAEIHALGAFSADEILGYAAAAEHRQSHPIAQAILLAAQQRQLTIPNDSIALKQAEVSVSIMGATTVATDTAQIVLMDHTLSQLDTLFDMVARYERDLQAQYILGIHIPAGYIAGVLAFGWGMVSSCVVGYIVFLTATGLAFRPIWRQERMEAKPHPSPVQTR